MDLQRYRYEIRADVEPDRKNQLIAVVHDQRFAQYLRALVEDTGLFVYGTVKVYSVKESE
jgi:hypothetical protein